MHGMLCIVHILWSPHSYTNYYYTMCGHGMVWRNIEAYYTHNMLGPYTEYRVCGPHIYMGSMHIMLCWGLIILYSIVCGVPISTCVSHTASYVGGLD